MPSVAEALKPAGIFDEPINVDDCNPLLLQQLERQEYVNRQPLLLRGCEVSIHGNTVTIQEGKVLLPGQWLKVAEAASIVLAPADAHNPRINTVILRAYANEENEIARIGPVSQVVVGSPAVVPAEPCLPVSAIRLASVLVSAGNAPSPTLYFGDGQELRDELTKRAREVRARQDACRHVGAHRVEITQLQSVRRIFTVRCPSCDLTWTEGAGERCCKDTVCYCGQGALSQ